MAIYNSFPVGKSEIFIGKKAEGISASKDGFFDKFCRIYGAAQVDILAPDSIFIPVLPLVSNGKLKFPLCAKCVDSLNPEFCTHKTEERMLRSVWTTVELEFAIECGYRILKIHEMFGYRKCEPIFQSFYLSLARKKLESEGFPANVVSEIEKDKYVADLNEAMPGLKLEKEKVKRNDARRQFCKDCSNLSLGKFSQNNFKANVKYIHSYSDYLRERNSNPKVSLKSICPINQNLAELSFEPNDEWSGQHKGTHVVLYAFITSYARKRLNADMRLLQTKGASVFYCDTDSVKFTFPEEQREKFTEIEKELKMGSPAYLAYKYETDSPIISWTSLGAKNYSYVQQNGSSVVKCRGFTLQSPTAQAKLTHETMKEMLLQYLRSERHEVRVKNFTIKIHRQSATLTSSTVEKKYVNNDYDKRIIVEGGAVGDNPTVCTYPFGLVHDDFSDTIVSPLLG